MKDKLQGKHAFFFFFFFFFFFSLHADTQRVIHEENSSCDVIIRLYFVVFSLLQISGNIRQNYWSCSHLIIATVFQYKIGGKIGTKGGKIKWEELMFFKEENKKDRKFEKKRKELFVRFGVDFLRRNDCNPCKSFIIMIITVQKLFLSEFTQKLLAVILIFFTQSFISILFPYGNSFQTQTLLFN